MAVAPLIPIALTLAATAVSAGGMIMQGQAASSAAKYQANIARMNAAIAEENAKRRQDRGNEEQLEMDRQTAAQLGEIETIQAASGLGGRTQMLTRKSAIEIGRRDAIRVRERAEMDAYNMRLGAANQVAEAGALEAKGANARTASSISATGSLLSGASSILGKFDMFKLKASA